MSKELPPSLVFPRFVLRNWYLISILLILLCTFILRFDRLGIVPSGMTWDEAAIGYNGHAVLTTRRDEWLVRLPVSFQSFGDYKAPLSIYINGIFTYIFGMSIIAVRIPFALAGVGSVLGMILLTKQFLKQYLQQLTIKDMRILSLFAGGLMMTSPWHFHFSRAGFESGLALFFIVWGFYLLLLFLSDTVKQKILQGALLLASSTLFVLALYTYHSAKIFVPLILLSFVVFHYKKLLNKWLYILLASIWGLIILKPLMSDTFWGKGGERFVQTSIFTSNSYWYSQLGIAIGNFWRHFSPQFLLFGKTTTLRHGDGMWGVLLITELLLFIIFILLLLRKMFFHSNLKGSIPTKKVVLFPLVWIVAGLIPAAIGTEIPHSNRALLAYPGVILASILTLSMFIYNMKQTENINVRNVYRIILGIGLLLHVLLFLDYRHDYFNDYAKNSSNDFYFGYVEAMEIADKYEDEVDKILFTSEYGQPYIFALFVRQTNPIWYQGGSLIKYEFTDKIAEQDMLRNNTLIIATPRQINPSKANELIIAPSGEVKFVVVYPQVHQ